ncbi:MAG: OmpA family protein [Candidatus Zixiibacteriota bacterium]
MKKERMIQLFGVCLIPFLLLAFLGCASTKYVNRKVEELEGKIQKNQEEIETLGQNLDQVDNKAEKAKSSSEQALKEAQEALKKAVALGEYKEFWRKEINFDFDKYILTNIGQNVLDEIGLKMQEDHQLILEISGHTDAIGNNNYNLLLGHNRAESVKRYLVEKFKISLAMMYTVSFGESKPVAENDSPKGRTANRRAELRLLAP